MARLTANWTKPSASAARFLRSWTSSATWVSVTSTPRCGASASKATPSRCRATSTWPLNTIRKSPSTRPTPTSRALTLRSALRRAVCRSRTCTFIPLLVPKDLPRPTSGAASTSSTLLRKVTASPSSCGQRLRVQQPPKALWLSALTASLPLPPVPAATTST